MKIGIAVKQGKAQVQGVTYNTKGAATISELSGWVSLTEAQKLRAVLMASVAK